MKSCFQRSSNFNLSQVSALGSEVGRNTEMGFTLHFKPFQWFSFWTHTLNVSTVKVWCMGQTPACGLLAPLSSSCSSHISACCLLSDVSAFQKSAMKPHTCAIMTPESHGDESTSGMWNSAHVWPGKSSVKEPTTHVRSSCYSALTVSCFYSLVSFCWDDKRETWWWDVYLLQIWCMKLFSLWLISNLLNGRK